MRPEAASQGHRRTGADRLASLTKIRAGKTREGALK
jgi:hypothetical protein